MKNQSLNKDYSYLYGLTYKILGLKKKKYIQKKKYIHHICPAS